MLTVTIPDEIKFYSLYADGLFSRKTYVREAGYTLFSFDPDAVVFCYYTYPTHREACAVRNVPSGSVLLPGLSKPVSLLFSVHASRVDKLRRAVGFLNANSGGAYSFNDGFYIRLAFILSQRGKINYFALHRLAGDTAGG
ncbi:MAG: hypothetical protein LBF63_05125 [Treponema sp.]|jgi:hypothetical protein|nr:hypothetical protein [Treponema sp.]